MDIADRRGWMPYRTLGVVVQKHRLIAHMYSMEFIKWIVTSSSDPTKYSLIVKGALSMGAAYLVQLLPILCGLALVCLSVDGSVLASAIDTVANVVYMALSLVGAIAFLYGLA